MTDTVTIISTSKTTGTTTTTGEIMSVDASSWHPPTSSPLWPTIGPGDLNDIALPNFDNPYVSTKVSDLFVELFRHVDQDTANTLKLKIYDYLHTSKKIDARELANEMLEVLEAKRAGGFLDTLKSIEDQSNE